ncbi:MAG: aminoglycoside phosphotransferase family protein [Clostridia bacterium]|nr:aminoglycoside phosphotransferase family protein [Clostridia bacterium]
MRSTALEEKLKHIGDVFRIQGTLYSILVMTDGNINSTYKLGYRREDGTVKAYVAQKINPYVFKHPAEIMNNIDLVTSHIRNNLAEGQISLHFHHTADGKNYYVDEEDGSFWRLYTFINALSFNTSDSLTVLKNAGEAFGQFQMQLSDFDAAQLFETIPDFHNTKKRLDTFFSHVEEDPLGRAASIQEEIDYLRSVRELASRLSEMLERGELPLRVTHNDTKINNVLFDKKTQRSLVVIDLDTVMPGLAMHDFGDAVRFAGQPLTRQV